MESIQGYEPWGMGSSPIKLTKITCGVMVTLKILILVL